MSISHWGFFPGYWHLTSGYLETWPVWQPCPFEELIQWQ